MWKRSQGEASEAPATERVGNRYAEPNTTAPHLDSTPIRNSPSAADGLNLGLKRAKHEWAVCAHQDVFLPDGRDGLLAQQLGVAERRFGPIGVAGVYGVGDVIENPDFTQPLAAERIGWVVDRGRMLRDGPELPARVSTLDELLLVVRRDSGLRFDPSLGFHLYGADICLQARELGLAVVALAAPCHHNSRSVGLPEAFFASAEVFARKWSHRLPVATPSVIIDRFPGVHLLGNANSDGSRSIVRAVNSAWSLVLGPWSEFRLKGHSDASPGQRPQCP
jgi:Glycosyltransferase like family